MSKNIKKYGIIATYQVGTTEIVWFFTETQRNRMLFEMKSKSEIKKVKPKNR